MDAHRPTGAPTFETQHVVAVALFSMRQGDPEAQTNERLIPQKLKGFPRSLTSFRLPLKEIGIKLARDLICVMTNGPTSAGYFKGCQLWPATLLGGQSGGHDATQAEAREISDAR